MHGGLFEQSLSIMLKLIRKIWIAPLHRFCLFFLARGLSSTVNFTFNAIGQQWQPCWMRIMWAMHGNVRCFSTVADHRGKVWFPFWNEMFLLYENVIPCYKWGWWKFDNLQVSFAKSPPMQSRNVIRRKDWVWFPIKIFSKQVSHKIAVAGVESFVPQSAGGIYIY